MTREYKGKTAELRYNKVVSLTIRPPKGGAIPRSAGARVMEAVVALQKAGYDVTVKWRRVNGVPHQMIRHVGIGDK